MPDPYYRPDLVGFDPGLQHEPSGEEPGGRSERVRGPYPIRVKGPFPERAAGDIGFEEPAELAAPAEAAPREAGFWEWTDPKTGVHHVTDKPETIPLGADARKVTAPTTFDESDEERENRIVSEIAQKSGKSLVEARQAFLEARGELTGETETGTPASYEQKIAARDRIRANTQDLLDKATTVAEKNAILREVKQVMSLHGLDKIEKEKPGKIAEQPAIIKEAEYLLDKGIAENIETAYDMAKQAKKKDITEEDYTRGIVRSALIKDPLISDDELIAIEQRAKKFYGVRPEAPAKKEPAVGEEPKISLPKEVTTTSQAVAWLRENQGMSKDEAVAWIKGQS